MPASRGVTSAAFGPFPKLEVTLRTFISTHAVPATQELFLGHCASLTSNEIVALVAAMPALRKLSLVHCDQLTRSNDAKDALGTNGERGGGGRGGVVELGRSAAAP